MKKSGLLKTSVIACALLFGTNLMADSETVNTEAQPSSVSDDVSVPSTTTTNPVTTNEDEENSRIPALPDPDEVAKNGGIVGGPVALPPELAARLENLPIDTGLLESTDEEESVENNEAREEAVSTSSTTPSTTTTTETEETNGTDEEPAVTTGDGVTDTRDTQPPLEEDGEEEPEDSNSSLGTDGDREGEAAVDGENGAVEDPVEDDEEEAAVEPEEPVVDPEAKAKEKKAAITKQTEAMVKNLGSLGTMAEDEIKELYTVLVDIPNVTLNDDFDVKNLDKDTKAKVQTAVNNFATKVAQKQKSSTASTALSAFNVQINNMNKRLGEIRGLNGDVGVWLRAYGGRTTAEDKSHSHYYSIQTGADKKTELNDADLITGGVIGFDKVNAQTSSKGYNLGLYVSYIHNDGYFADAVLKYARTSYKQDKIDFKKQNSILLSLESGYRFSLNDAVYLEPSLGIITGNVGKFEQKTENSKITVDSFTPFILKPQVFAGFMMDDFIFRAGVGAMLNFTTPNANLEIKNVLNGVDAFGKIKLPKYSYGFVNLGTSYKVSDNLRLNFNVEKGFASKLKRDYELNATIRYTF